MPDGGGGGARTLRGGRVRYVQPDGRGLIKLKWNVDSGEGAGVFLAERLQKRLIKFGWPVDYTVTSGTGGNGDRLSFRLLTGRATPEFRAALRNVAGVEARFWRLPIACKRSSCWIVGPHWLDVRVYWSGGKSMRVARLKRGGPAVRAFNDPPF